MRRDAMVRSGRKFRQDIDDVSSISPNLPREPAPHREGPGANTVLAVGHVAESKVVARIDRISRATRSHGSRNGRRGGSRSVMDSVYP
jgi:hypothetical protein